MRANSFGDAPGPRVPLFSTLAAVDSEAKEGSLVTRLLVAAAWQEHDRVSGAPSRRPANWQGRHSRHGMKTHVLTRWRVAIWKPPDLRTSARHAARTAKHATSISKSGSRERYQPLPPDRRDAVTLKPALNRTVPQVAWRTGMTIRDADRVVRQPQPLPRTRLGQARPAWSPLQCCGCRNNDRSALP